MKQKIRSFFRNFSTRSDVPAGPVIVLFHDVPEGQASHFADTLAFLKDNYRPISLDEYLAKGGRADRSFVVTFDDNFKSWLTVALPTLARLDIPATFYLNTCLYDDPPMLEAYAARIAHKGIYEPLSEAELRTLSDAPGVTIGAHGHSHRMLSRLDEEDALEDIGRSVRRLTDLTGRQVRHFAYPYGMRRHFTSRLRRRLPELGIASCANGIPATRPAGWNPLDLYRTALDGLDSAGARAKLRVDQTMFTRFTGRSLV